MPSMPTRPCDCLDYCGDDPAITAGRAAPCERKLRHERDLREGAERMHLQHAIALEAALRCIRAAAPVEAADGVDYHRIDKPELLGQAHADVARAARFLLLSQRAAQHPEQPGLLRLITPPPAPQPAPRRRTHRSPLT